MLKNSMVRAALLACMSVLSLPVQADVDAAKSQAISIPAGDLTKALELFVKQSGVDIVYRPEQLLGLKTKGVSGQHSTRDAIAKLLEGTPLVLSTDASGAMLIALPLRPGDRSVPKAVAISDVRADAATYGLIDLAQALPSEVAADTGGRAAEKKSGDTVEEMVVEESRIKPFSDRNFDKPRTINDEQPYYIFDSQTIERSGAQSVGDFLKQRLTMNTVGLTDAQDIGGGFGGSNKSTINLRGLGSDKTLILVNGRRIAGIVSQSTDIQADINGIPLSAIDRIEVLPSSASGIYGGSAIGGVVNVVLKKDFAGGEVRLAYDNTWDTDSPTRRASATFGQSLEGGKTNYMLTGQWSESQPLLFGDRRQLMDRGFGKMLSNSPTSIYSPTNPFQGAAPNITSTSYYDSLTATFTPDPGVLVLKDGRSLGTRNTTIPFGTAPNVSQAVLADLLLQNSGRWNLDLPETIQSPTGLLRPLSGTPTMKSIMGTVRRQMSSRVEAYLELGYQSNYSYAIHNLLTNGGTTVPVSTPTRPTANPFNSAVLITFPNTFATPNTQDSVNRAVTAGLNIRLPQDWVVALDYSWSKNTYRFDYYNLDYAARDNDLNNGTLNLFADTMMYPVNFAKYQGWTYFSGNSVMDAFNLRGAGSLPRLPWGAPSMIGGVEHRIADVPRNVGETFLPITTTENNLFVAFPRRQTTDSVYAELQVPLVAKDSLPLLHALDLQLSGRSERYKVDSGTMYATYYVNNPSRPPSYGSPTLNGQPLTAETSYTSNNSTLGFKYQPIEALTFRASWATAFIPPTTSQLTPDPSISISQLTDPRTLLPVAGVRVTNGGNQNLQPQNSASRNAGLIWEPKSHGLNGLRFNAEYYKIEQFDRISSLGAQAILNFEGLYPERVTRDGTGRIVAVDNSMLNLFKLATEGWDFSLDYRFTTGIGAFNVRTVQTYILNEERQQNASLPLLNYAGYVAEGGPNKYKANLSVNWEWRNLLAGWTTYYFGSYKQYGAVGGPNATQRALTGTTPAGRAPQTTYTVPQGANSVSSQAYHDLFASYSFGKQTERGGGAWTSQLLSGLTLQLGIKNVFNTLPPFDAFYVNSYYISPFGDKRLRSYWINATKQF